MANIMFYAKAKVTGLNITKDMVYGIIEVSRNSDNDVIFRLDSMISGNVWCYAFNFELLGNNIESLELLYAKQTR